MTMQAEQVAHHPGDLVIDSIQDGLSNKVVTHLKNHEGLTIIIEEENPTMRLKIPLLIKSYLNTRRITPLEYKYSPELTLSMLKSASKTIEAKEIEVDMIREAEKIAIMDRDDARYWVNIYKWGYFVIFMGLVAFAVVK